MNTKTEMNNDLSKGKKVLILAAHPDDPVGMMGGTMVKLVNEGHKVNVFAFGNGDEAYARPGGKAQAIKDYAEQMRNVYDFIGCGIETLSLPDFENFETAELYRACIGAIRKYQPDVIFAHYWAEYFQHHTMATISRDAWNQARWECSGDCGSAWKCPRYFHFCGKDGVGEVTHIIDITDTFERGLQARHKFEMLDNFGGKVVSTVDFARAKAAYYGAMIGVKYGEAFQESFYFPTAMSGTELFFR